MNMDHEIDRIDAIFSESLSDVKHISGRIGTVHELRLEGLSKGFDPKHIFGNRYTTQGIKGMNGHVV